jgi:hypothetical protein
MTSMFRVPQGLRSPPLAAGVTLRHKNVPARTPLIPLKRDFGWNFDLQASRKVFALAIEICNYYFYFTGRDNIWWIRRL